MSENEGILARVKELQTAVADGVIVLEVRKRSARVQVLQANLDSERSAGDGVGRGSRGDYRHTGQGLPRGFRGRIALLAELRPNRRRAAEEMSQANRQRAPAASSLTVSTTGSDVKFPAIVTLTFPRLSHYGYSVTTAFDLRFSFVFSLRWP